ncbi:hypothetical protein ACOMHN_005096 [Nucella lapillus]
MDASPHSVQNNPSAVRSTTTVSTTNMAAVPRNRHAAVVVFLQWLQQRKIRSMRRHRAMYLQSLGRRKAFLARMRLRNKFFLTTMISTQLLQQIPRVERTIWRLPRSSSWWEHTVLESYTNEQWLESFRVTKETFHLLCSCLRPYMERASTRLRAAIPLEQRMGIALYRLASGASIRAVGRLFGASPASVCLIIRDFTKGLVENLLPEFVSFPQGERLQKVVTGFEQKWGFPQCVGVVGETHIPVMPSAADREDYVNAKGWCSVHGQCIVDHQLLFTDVFVGWPGHSHEAHAFKNSPVYENSKTSTPFFPAQPRCINDVQVPLVLVGESPYPLKDWLMKPFPATENLTQQQRGFNYQVSKTRMAVEIALGRLKGRWRILLKTAECSIDNVPDVVLACCVLHNMCEVWGEHFLAHWIDEMSAEERDLHRQQPPRHEYWGREKENAKIIRNTLAAYLENYTD